MFKDTVLSILKEHQIYISRALELAKAGIYRAMPNPSVGAVIVHENKIIAEGFTSAYGGAHAEVNAISQVNDKQILKQSTLYVTLEPCSHFGKTPPCSDLIIQMQIPRVVIGTVDPFASVKGKGIEKLKKAGCQVIVGVLEKQCQQINKRFFNFIKNKRPYIILKWAQTSKGFIAPLSKNEKAPFWISNTYSKQLVHKWRSEECAFLVGTNTVLQDNPSLTTRDWYGPNPIRLFIDKNAIIDNSYNLLDNSTPTICFTQNKQVFDKANLKYIQVDFQKNIPLQILEHLYKLNIMSLVIEGGSKTIESFIEQQLWDEARIFTGQNNINKGVLAPKITDFKSIESYYLLKDQLDIVKRQNE
ncbi:bifunctional diaminohydroxyphosphoribosylaminopyrimidine deaminase/5-amino-6-(5-phosphoribosylamino)uracil reductase RibD [Myroides sp. LJL119]